MASRLMNGGSISPKAAQTERKPAKGKMMGGESEENKIVS